MQPPPLLAMLAVALAGQGGNLQTFTGALGGIRADAITATGDGERPFAAGGDTFVDLAGAGERSCDDQMNSCAAMANSGGVGFGVADCDDQAAQCKAAVAAESTTPVTSATTSASATQTAPVSLSLASQNADFDFFCEV